MIHYVTKHGECLEYEDMKKFLYILFRAFGLTELAARRSVDIALTLDGLQLTKHLAFVMNGVKLVDIACRNPCTGLLDLQPISDETDKNKKKYVPQSPRWCFPTKYCMGRKIQAMYQEEFKEMFEILFQAAEVGQTEFPGWEPLNFANPANMAAIQKCLGLGGACKVTKYFCYCCSIVSHLCATGNTGDKICRKCDETHPNNPQWKCFHHEMSNCEQLEKCSQALEDLKINWQSDMKN